MSTSCRSRLITHITDVTSCIIHCRQGGHDMVVHSTNKEWIIAPHMLPPHMTKLLSMKPTELDLCTQYSARCVFCCLLYCHSDEVMTGTEVSVVKENLNNDLISIKFSFLACVPM